MGNHTWARSDPGEWTSRGEGVAVFLGSEGGCFRQKGLKGVCKFRFCAFFYHIFSGEGVCLSAQGGVVPPPKGLRGALEWLPLLTSLPIYGESSLKWMARAVPFVLPNGIWISLFCVYLILIHSFVSKCFVAGYSFHHRETFYTNCFLIVVFSNWKWTTIHSI